MLTLFSSACESVLNMYVCRTVILQFTVPVSLFPTVLLVDISLPVCLCGTSSTNPYIGRNKGIACVPYHISRPSADFNGLVCEPLVSGLFFSSQPSHQC